MCFGFAPNEEIDATQQATVSKTDGLFVFIESTPTAKYTGIGTVKTPTFIKTDKLKHTIPSAIKRTKKQYPNADGIIITDQYDWQAIEFLK